MLALQTQSKYIKKQVRLPDGTLALVVFELVNINGKITAKAVYGEILNKTKKVENEVILALPVYFEKLNIKPIVSPFFGNVLELVKDLSFVVSQPSRAPNYF